MSSSDPIKAAYLKYLIEWVQDWRADGQLLSDAMNRMPTSPQLTASLPQVDFPDPPRSRKCLLHRKIGSVAMSIFT